MYAYLLRLNLYIPVQLICLPLAWKKSRNAAFEDRSTCQVKPVPRPLTACQRVPPNMPTLLATTPFNSQKCQHASAASKVYLESKSFE